MIKRLIRGLIHCYKYLLHPVYAGIKARNPEFKVCNYHPTCSDYALAALEKYPAMVAIKLMFNRISRCNSKNGGIDLP